MTQSHDSGRRTRVTRPYPSYTLEDSLSVARAIYDLNAGLPFDRELLAGALGTTPKSSAFTMRLNASAAYGLTEGGYNDPDISLTVLGEAAVAPDMAAEREAAVAAAAANPDVFGRFYELLDGRYLPESDYLYRILQRDLGVRAELVQECLGILRDNGVFAGIISEDGSGYRVMLPRSDVSTEVVSAPGRVATEPPTPYETRPRFDRSTVYEEPMRAGAGTGAGAGSKIFVGHIGDSDAAGFVVSMLSEFDIPSVGSRIPDGGLLVPPDVSRLMREASAAVLVFRGGDAARSSRDKMIGLLGAASVLFDDRVVLLYEDDADSSVGSDGLSCISFDRERPKECGFDLLLALHKAGLIKVSV